MSGHHSAIVCPVTVREQNHIMEDAGQRLKKRREELNLRYRDVEELSLQIASRRNNDEYAIAISRLADIENKGTVPSLYRLYSLCAIYRLDWLDVLEWYSIDISMLPADAAQIDVGAHARHRLSFRRLPARSVTAVSRSRPRPEAHLLSEPHDPALGHAPAHAVERHRPQGSSIRLRRERGLVDVPADPAGLAGADRRDQAQDRDQAAGTTSSSALSTSWSIGAAMRSAGATFLKRTW